METFNHRHRLKIRCFFFDNYEKHNLIGSYTGMISANINYINRSGHSVEFEGGIRRKERKKKQLKNEDLTKKRNH